MAPEELAEVLRRMVADPPHPSITTTLNLFGIRYADELGSRTNEIVKLARAAGTQDRLRKGAGAEIRRGKRLAGYVNLNTAGRRAVR